MNSNLLFSQRSKASDFPFQVVVKQHFNKKTLYVTYGNGPKQGGGTWTENLYDIYPRTLVMIEERLGKDVVKELETLQKIPMHPHTYKQS